MLELKFIRENFELVAAGVRKKNVQLDLSRFQSLEETRRSVLLKVEELKARRNRVSEEIAQIKKNRGEAADRIA